MNSQRRLSLLLVGPLLLLMAVWMVQCEGAQPDDVAVDETETDTSLTCNATYNLPASVSKIADCQDASDPQQCDIDYYSWQTFLALNAPSVGDQVSTTGDNVTQWASWSSTADLLDQGSNPGSSGSRSYPDACQSIPNYQNYRVIDQVGKVDDSFLEAQTQGLSANPVLASNGTFLRYEILLSPATYTWVVAHGLNRVTTLESWAQAGTEVTFPCGMPSYTGGDPADSLMGAMVLKNAWMDMTDSDATAFHTEDLLIYTPGYHNSTGQATCELKTMGLVGMHIAHKTLSQPNWTWSTFEHANNAPNCTGPPADGDGGASPDSLCPASATQDWNFYGETCNDGDACQTCNTVPALNGVTGSDTLCVNPTSGVGGWCLDQPPAASAGLSKLCRQIPLDASGDYSSAYTWNTACEGTLGGGVWSNYQLISTQWLDQQNAPTTCRTNQTQITATSAFRPKTSVTGSESPAGSRPFLGNTSMESYERSNCSGCHTKGFKTKFVVEGDTLTIVNDFMYWLVLEVPAAGNQ